MGSAMKFYFDFMSPPSRGLYILFKMAKVPYEEHQVAIRKGEHKDPSYKNINRFQKVPCIVDNGFKLSESVAILRYLDSKGLISDSWYPKEIKVRARTDEYLQWQHNNIRMGMGMYFMFKVVHPLFFGEAVSPKQVAFAKQIMENSLDSIEKIWLADNKFLTGDKVNIADLFSACDIEHTRTCGYDPTAGRPKLKTWLSAVKDATEPYYSEAHKYVDSFAEKIGSKL